MEYERRHDCWMYVNYLNIIIINNSFFVVKIYGAAVTFFEVLPEEKLTEDRKKALQLNGDGDDDVSAMIICDLSLSRVKVLLH